ncbi:MAG: hypothetical protein HOI95_07230, partial [Chromatiales bacterium]|nr:hypothetical protein [Chromatiales bacterium]
PGDVIFAVGDETVAGMRDLPRLIAGMQIDKSVALHVWRDGRETVLKASLRAVDRPERVASVEREEATPPLGLALAPLSDRYRSELGWPHEAHGVVVVGVAPGSQADAQRIRPGMVITMVGRHAVDSPQAVAELVGEARALKRKNVLLLISNRFGNAEFVALPLV